MLPKINPASTKAWKALTAHREQVNNVSMRELFRNEPDRFKRLSIRFEDILFDYSKNIITNETLSLLQQLARECGLDAAKKARLWHPD